MSWLTVCLCRGQRRPAAESTEVRLSGGAAMLVSSRPRPCSPGEIESASRVARSQAGTRRAALPPEPALFPRFSSLPLPLPLAIAASSAAPPVP